MDGIEGVIAHQVLARGDKVQEFIIKGASATQGQRLVLLGQIEGIALHDLELGNILEGTIKASSPRRAIAVVLLDELIVLALSAIAAHCIGTLIRKHLWVKQILRLLLDLSNFLSHLNEFTLLANSLHLVDNLANVKLG